MVEDFPGFTDNRNGSVIYMDEGDGEMIILKFPCLLIFAALLLCCKLPSSSNTCSAAQLVVISAITAAKKPSGVQIEGDIVGVFPDTWQFSNDEKDLFTIIKVDGLLASELESLLMIEIREIDDGGTEWCDTDGKWYKLKARPKFLRNVSTITEKELSDLSKTEVSKSQKISIIEKAKNRIEDDPSNTSILIAVK